MAIEIPNAFEAGGIFDGKNPPTLDNPILSGNGIQPFDPSTKSTSFATAKGGFTLFGGVGPGTLSYYLIKLVTPIDGAEAALAVTKLWEPIPINPAIPAALVTPDGNIEVADSTAGIEGGAYYSFYLMVFRIQTGPNATPSE